MNSEFINIKSIRNISNDNISNFLNSFLLSISGIKHLNRISSEISVDPDNYIFFKNLLQRLDIQVFCKNLIIPETGPFIVVLPFSSGLFEFSVFISSFFNDFNKDNIKFLTTSQPFNLCESFSSYMISSGTGSFFKLTKSAVDHLNNEKPIVYFTKVDSLNNIDKHNFSFPFYLSNITSAPLYLCSVDFDTSSWIYYLSHLNDWFYFLLSVRRLISESNSTVALRLSDKITSNNITTESLSYFYNIKM